VVERSEELGMGRELRRGQGKEEGS